MNTLTPKIEPKVKAGAKSIAASTPGAVVIVWLITLTGIEVPPLVAVAVGSLVTGAFSFLVSYYKK